MQETPAAFMKKCREMKRDCMEGGIYYENPSKRYMPIFVLPTFFAFILAYRLYYGNLVILQIYNRNRREIRRFSNYRKHWKDTAFRHSFWYTVLFAIASLLIINISIFALAMALTKEMHGTNVFRTVFFMPNLIGGIVLGYYILQLIFNEFFQIWYRTCSE